MVTILSVFTSTSFKEIRLPNLVNTDFSFKLFKDIFSLSRDMEIHLENIDGVWCVPAAILFRYGDLRRISYIR